jgi:FAD/FMN-containing dehydrogenase
MQWPAFQKWLENSQPDEVGIWTFRQKQTGADSLSIGGAVSANVHGRGLAFGPFVEDVESLRVVTAAGEFVDTSREERADLFASVCGGYGMFGIIVEVTLRLERRQLVKRVVDVTLAEDLPVRFAERIEEGFRYGDWQYDIDPSSPTFLKRGILSCYRPVSEDDETVSPGGETALTREDWAGLVELVRQDKTLAFETYRSHYLATDGQHYWSDTHQNATYLDNYAELLRLASGGGAKATLMITELYVPRADLPAFLARAADTLREQDAEVLYGTVRLIERDDTTLLPWAREPWACTIFNLLVEHTQEGIEHASEAFRALIDDALAYSGSFYLTYHRWADGRQLLAGHPTFPEFIAAKKSADPNGVFRSDWYDHVRAAVAQLEPVAE